MSALRCAARYDETNRRMRCMRCDLSWAEDDPVPKCRPFITPAELLREAARLFEDRNATYGSNYQDFGAALLALFPKGIPAVNNAADANRLNLIICCLNKLRRYAINFSAGGHLDSARDLQVYAAMLEEMTNDADRR